MRSEWLAYLVTDAMSSSFEIISVTVMAIYHRSSKQIGREEFLASEIFGISALLFGVVVGTEYWVG